MHHNASFIYFSAEGNRSKESPIANENIILDIKDLCVVKKTLSSFNVM